MSAGTRTIDLNLFGRPSVKRRKQQVEDLEKFAPGAIIKVKVHNFVTYATTEFTLSPSLNMIIGPNGTGKSTFVCAVCLGLGGSPTLLGRQKAVGEFIKNGEDSATIEITLKNQQGRSNLVIKREIYKKTDKSDWYLQGKPVSERKVKSALTELNIQLDNLCQFLPQEKVADFAKLTPEKLLIETQRAIDVKSLQQHENLIKLDTERIKISTLLEAKEKELVTLESQKERYEAAARQYRDYENKKSDLDKYEKILPWAQLNDFKHLVDELKTERNELIQQLDELNNSPLRLDGVIADLNTQAEEYRNSARDLRAKNKANMDTVEASKSRMEKLRKRKIEIEARIDGFAKSRIDMEQKLVRAKQVKADTEESLQRIPQFDPSQVKELEKHIDRLYSDRSEIDDRVRQEQSEYRQVDHEIRNYERNIDNLKRELKTQDRISVLDTNNNQHGNGNGNGNSSRNSAKYIAKAAVIELRTNLKQFRKDIFEPPVLTVRATEDIYAAYLDKIVDSMTQLSMTARNKQAYDVFSKEIMDIRNINVPFRYLSNRPLKGAFTRQQLNEFGFECYLVDVLNGPEPVIQMLKEQSFIYDIPVSKKPLSPQQIERLKTPVNGQVPFKKFFSGDNLISISSSRYGQKQRIIKSESISRKNIMFSTGGISNERKTAINNQVRDLEDRKEKSVEKREELARRANSLRQESKGLGQEFDEKTQEKKKIALLNKEREKCQARIQSATDRIADIEKDLATDNTTELMKQKLKLKRLAEQRIAAVAEVAESMVKYNSEAKEISLLDARILVTMGKIQSFEALNKGIVDQREHLKNQIQEVKQRIQALKRESGYTEWQRQVKSYTDEELETLREVVTNLTEQGTLTVAHVQDIIEKIRGDLKLLSNSSKSSVKELKQLNSKLDDLNEEIPLQRQQLKEKLHEIKNIREEWEPRLQRIVDEISKKFAAIFPSVGSAGEVQLTRAEKFQDWKLEILVAFREEADLKALDSHTQSGGERAVSTVYFMISLQNLTNSPFRVVDEINQGMDARNERIVHENMVKVACQENTSQYFLITPKLLTDLYYHPKMRVHCILAGPWIPNPTSDSDYLGLGTTSTYYLSTGTTV